MNKKMIISLIMLFVLIVQFLPHLTYASNNIVYDISKNSEFFDSLGIIDNNSEFSPDAKISKSEFVSLLVKLVGYNESGFSAEIPYSDVYKGHEYISEISYAYEFGVFNNSWEVLYPDDNLTMYFASEVLKNTLGYNKLTDSEALSVQKYLTEDIIPADNNVLNLGMAYEMLYRATNVPIVEEVSINPFGVQYRVSDITLLNKYFDITKVSGRVDKTSVASFDGEHTAKAVICIDGESYRIDKTDTTDYFGRYVDAYIENLGSENIIKYIMVSNKNTEIVISAENFVSFSNNSVNYYNGKNMVSNKTDSPLIVYNGEDVSGSEYSQSLFDIDDGTVTLVYNSNDVCDLIVIEEYENMLVSLVDLEDEVIYSKKVGDEPIKYKDAHILNFYVYNGYTIEEAVAESITVDSLITYSRSINGKCIEIYLSTKTINSQLKQIDNDDNGKTECVVLSDGLRYAVSGSMCMPGISKLNFGTYYNFFISFLGNIGAVTAVGDDTDLYGFIAKAGVTNALAGTVQYRIITNLSTERTGEIILTSADSVTVDGKKCYSAKEALDAIKTNNSQSVKVPIIFKLNSDNRIKYIDTPYYNESAEAKNSLRERNFGSKFAERVQVAVPNGYTNLLAQRYFVPLNGLVVITPEGKDDEIRKMQRIPSKAVTASSGYLTKNIKAYSLGDTTAICPIVVWVDNQADTESTQYEKKIFLVEKISDTLYEDEERTKLTLNNGASTTDYYVNSDIPIDAMSSLSVGDVVRVSFNSYDEVDGLEIMMHGKNPHSDVGYVYVYNTAKENGNTPYLMGHEFRVAVGLVKSVEYDAMTGKYYVTYMLGNDTADTSDIEATYVIDSAKSYKLIERTGEIDISPIAAGNIRTYDSVGADADVIIVRYEFCVPITQYIVTK